MAVGKNNFHQQDPRRTPGDGTTNIDPGDGTGDMLKAVYDSNDDGRVDSADVAIQATSATDLDTVVGFSLYYGTNELGVQGWHTLPAGSVGSSTLEGLTDVDLSVAPTDGQFLAYDAGSGTWKPITASAIVAELGDVGDVDLATTPPTDGQVIVWDSAESKWVPYTLQEVDATTLKARTTKTTDASGELPNWAAWIADTTSSALSRAMPTSPTDGEEVTVTDINGNAATNNITLTVTSPTTIVSETVDTDGQSKKWRYDASGDVWDLVFSDTPSTGGGGGGTTNQYPIGSYINVRQGGYREGDDTITLSDGSVWLKEGVVLSKSSYPDAPDTYYGTLETMYDHSAQAATTQCMHGDDDYIVVLGTGGAIHLYDTATGTFQETISTGSSSYDLVAVLGGYVFTALDDGTSTIVRRYAISDTSTYTELDVGLTNIKGLGGDGVSTLYVIAESGTITNDGFLLSLDVDGVEVADPIALLLQDTSITYSVFTITKDPITELIILNDGTVDNIFCLSAEGILITTPNFAKPSNCQGIWVTSTGVVWYGTSSSITYRQVIGDYTYNGYSGAIVGETATSYMRIL